MCGHYTKIILKFGIRSRLAPFRLTQYGDVLERAGIVEVCYAEQDVARGSITKKGRFTNVGNQDDRPVRKDSCYFCGNGGHKAKEYPMKMDGLYFRCGLHGHFSRECPTGLDKGRPRATLKATVPVRRQETLKQGHVYALAQAQAEKAPENT